MSTILETIGDLAYQLGDGNLETHRNECSEWWVSLKDALLDAVSRAAAADQNIELGMYEELEDTRR
jgi:hypothetical protein